jgi:hypothetical protein
MGTSYITIQKMYYDDFLNNPKPFLLSDFRLVFRSKLNADRLRISSESSVGGDTSIGLIPLTGVGFLLSLCEVKW